MNDNKIKQGFKIISLSLSAFMLMLLVFNIFFKSNSAQEYYKAFWIYFIIISAILNCEVFLIYKLCESFEDLNSQFNVVRINSKERICNWIIKGSPIIIISFITVVNLFVKITEYVFDKKIQFHISIKYLSCIFLCLTVALSFILLVLFIIYLFFINEMLLKATRNSVCCYPISMPLFREIKNIFTNVIFVYWAIITLYITLIFFHMYVYNGGSSNSSTNLLGNINQNFSYIWLLLIIVILIGYFVIFYFPNKILHNFVLKIKLQTIFKMCENLDSNSDFENMFSKLESVYNSPSSFQHYFLDKVITVLSTAITIAISTLQLIQK